MQCSDFGSIFKLLLGAGVLGDNFRGDFKKIVGEMHSSGQKLISTFGTLFWKRCGAENIVRFADHVAECFEIIPSRHEPTVAPLRSGCNRLQFYSTQL